jgi:hypothetical protein
MYGVASGLPVPKNCRLLSFIRRSSSSIRRCRAAKSWLPRGGGSRIREAERGAFAEALGERIEALRNEIRWKTERRGRAEKSHGESLFESWTSDPENLTPSKS